MQNTIPHSSLFQLLSGVFLILILILLAIPVEHSGDSAYLGATDSPIFQIKFAKMTVPSILSILFFGFSLLYHVSKPKNYRNRNFFRYLHYIFIFILAHYLSISFNGIKLSGVTLGISAWREMVEATLVYYGILLFVDSEKKFYLTVEILSVTLMLSLTYAIFEYFTGAGIAAFKQGSVVAYENAKLQLLLINITMLFCILLYSDGYKKMYLPRLVHFFSIAVSVGTIVLSSRRNSMVAMFIIFTLILGYGFLSRYKAVTIKLAIATSIVVVIALFTSYEIISQKVVTRMSTLQSIYTGELQKGDTLKGHFKDLRIGWQAVKRNILWGNGVDPKTAGFDDRMMGENLQPGEIVTWVHNGLLTIWLQFGIIGAVTYILLYMKILQRHLQYFLKYRSPLILFIGFYFIVFIAMEIFFPPFHTHYKDAVLLFGPLAMTSAYVNILTRLQNSK